MRRAEAGDGQNNHGCVLPQSCAHRVLTGAYPVPVVRNIEESLAKQRLGLSRNRFYLLDGLARMRVKAGVNVRSTRPDMLRA
jgi:hypothetical protein